MRLIPFTTECFQCTLCPIEASYIIERKFLYYDQTLSP